MVTDGVEVYRIIESRPPQESSALTRIAKLLAATLVALGIASPVPAAEKVFRYAFPVTAR